MPVVQQLGDKVSETSIAGMESESAGVQGTLHSSKIILNLKGAPNDLPQGESPKNSKMENFSFIPPTGWGGRCWQKQKRSSPIR